MFVLGIILGPIAENGLRDLLIVSDGAPIGFVFTRPIALVLVACIGLAPYYSFKPKPWEGEAGKSND